MNFRLAEMSDLPAINDLFTRMIEKMHREGVGIWDEVYPFSAFPGDIAAGQLWLLEDDTRLYSAILLTETTRGADVTDWSTPEKAYYCGRFGVDPDFQRQGIASLTVHKLMEVVKEKGGRSLRLFVVDCNLPAIRLYQKLGFSQVDSVYIDALSPDMVYKEYPFEIEV